MYPSVYTLFFHHQLSCRNLYIYLYALFLFEKYLSSIYHPLFSTLFFLRHYVQRYLWWWAFFSWCAFEGRKKASLTKKASVFCPAQVPSFGSLISFLSTTTITTYFPFFLTDSLQSSEVSTMLFLLLLLLLSSTSQCPKAREFFVFSFLYPLLFSYFLIFLNSPH